MDPVSKYSHPYQIMACDVDFMKKLKLSAAFNYFQEIAGLHADNLGIGFNRIYREFGVAWVLMRMRVDIERYPVWEEEVTIETWPQLPRKYDFDRDYIVRDAEGKAIMRAVSTWVIVDVATREIKKSEVIAIDYPPITVERAIECTLGKIKPQGQPQIAYKRVIGCSDIDMNGHINNSKYVDFIMDCFSVEDLKKYSAKSIQVNYLKESFPGDTIALYKNTDAAETGQVFVEGINEKDGSTVFNSRISILPSTCI
ncbi:MAG: thioesterase [Clostridiales bacterium]|jgi:acyl-ACP thioesterase|nr:thioesterase [Eubacteriales bacterium]MDH7567487.1 thioesterase [Clostridiales bacterium]